MASEVKSDNMSISIKGLSNKLNMLQGISSKDDLKLPKKTLNDQKKRFSFSDYQKSERDFAFIVNKEVKAQDLIRDFYLQDRNHL